MPPWKNLPRLGCVLSALVTVRCGDPTQVLVWAESAAGSRVRERATAMRVEVRDGDGAIVLDETRSLVGDPPEQAWPASISIVPKDDDPARTFEVAVSLVEQATGGAEAELARQTAEGGFVHRAVREIRLRFDDSCLGVSCGDGRTCIEGVCRRACFEATRPGEVARSAPSLCPCRCSCEGDRCQDGSCIPARPVAQVSAGHAHACALTQSGEVLCFGDNAHGQLGTGDFLLRDRPASVSLPAGASAIAAGPGFTCAALINGTIACWGEGAAGQLGPMVSGDRGEPTTLTDGAGSTIGGVVGIGAGGVADPAEASAHACAVLESGALLCWGQNDYGQLGVGVTGAPRPPERVMTSLAADDMAEVELGGFHTCARQRIGRLWCWGRDHDWQLGLPDQVDRSAPEVISDESNFTGIVDLAAGTWHSCAVTADGRLWCWGEDGEGRIAIASDDPEGRDVVAPTPVLEMQRWRSVEAGHRHTCAIDESGTLWCFGTSADGELGTLAASGRPTSPPTQLKDEPWASVSLGTAFTCGIRTGGALYCWGRNREAQLGIGATTSVSRPARVCLP